jgi:glutamate 5-kinase
MMDMDALVILTNVDGVYDGSPKEPGSKVIPVIKHGEAPVIDTESTVKSSFGRGGMTTKYKIASKLAGQGIAVHIANGTRQNTLVQILEDNSQVNHTTFLPVKKRSSGVRKWLAYSDDFARGEVSVNEGAREALLSDKAISLLFIGITNIEGHFKEGDIVRIKDSKGELIGLGRSSFSSEEARKEMGGKKCKPFVHYDYLYLY